VSVVLGIDAAWTRGQPSGVAVLASRGRTWRCVAVAPSYTSFLGLADGRPVDWAARPESGTADTAALIAATRRLAGAAPDVIAIDMPLARTPITQRRTADNAIASAFGARGLGAHSPNEARPGRIADDMHRGFAAHGFALACKPTPVGSKRSLLEVFPHAAVIELLGASYRVPYKLARAAQYWPLRDRAGRRRALLSQWLRIRRALDARISGIALPAPRSATLSGLKRYEDALDAVICAWVGAEFLARRACPHGDDDAAVWTVVSPVSSTRITRRTSVRTG
jgi:predicted RNase H-like nuclease